MKYVSTSDDEPLRVAKKKKNGKPFQLTHAPQTTKAASKQRDIVRSCARIFINDPLVYSEMAQLFGQVLRTSKQQAVQAMFGLNKNIATQGDDAEMTAASTWTPDVVQATIRDECRARVHRAGSKGYMLSFKDNQPPLHCTGLTRRLREGVMPALTSSTIHQRMVRPGHGQHFQNHKNHGGSSTKTGQLLDAEMAHMMCVQNRGGVVNVAQLASIGTVPSLLWTRPPRKCPVKGKTSRATAALMPAAQERKQTTTIPPQCPDCGLSGERYAREVPRWHPRTLAYLRDVHKLGLRLVDTQVPVAYGSAKIATEIDDILVDAHNNVVVVERKSGYKNIVGKPRKQRLTALEVCTTARTTQDGEPLVVLRAPYTEHTQHLLQASLGAEMFVQHALPPQWSPAAEQAAHVRRGVKRCVVYVSGESRAPNKDANDNLECSWVWAGEDYARAAWMLLPTL